MGRLLVSGCAATALLASAGNALAKSPQLVVRGATTTGASAQTVVELRGTQEDAASERVSIYVPNGYAANLGHPARTQIGTVAARAQLLALSPDIVDLAGSVLVADRDSTALQVDAARCTGTAAHAAVWLLHLVVSGRTFEVPVYADPAAGGETAFSSAKLVLCLPNPYAQAAPGTRSPSGTKLFDVRLALSAGVLRNPVSAGSHVWRTVITPWTVNDATPSPAGTMEAQGIVTIPSSLSLKAKLKSFRRRTHGRATVENSVLLSGRLLENLRGVGGAKVSFFASGKSAGSATTGSTGAFAKRVALGRTTTFRATATVPARETECVSPLPAVPAGCVSATLAGYKIGSDPATARPRRR